MYDLRYLPNKHGIRFTGILHDGKEVSCMVVFSEKYQMHIVNFPENSELKYEDLKTWK